MSKPSFIQAKKDYTGRCTMEHFPKCMTRPFWHTVFKKYVYYAPQYRTDREWYDNTTFPPESGTPNYCECHNQSWPLGQWLDKPYKKADHVETR